MGAGSVSAVLTRRAALSGAVASVALVGAAAAATMPIAAKGSISSEFASLLGRAEAAQRAAERHGIEVADPAGERFRAAVAAVERQTPHFSVDAGKAHDGDRLVWSTMNPTHVALTKTYVQMGREGRPWPVSTIAAARKFQAAHLRRTRTIGRATERARITSGFTQANIDNDALGNAWFRAQDAVTTFPVRNAADLAAKIARIIEWDLSDRYDELLADATRLANLEVRA